MSASAIVKDGKIQETVSQQSVQKAAGSKNGMDKDAFLQLLVAQMKYQDPLEPTSNTEYISQYATFSQVEQMQNMANSMELSRASSMVGKLVTIETTDNSGETKQVQGSVEYVSYENNKAYLSIDGTLYSADDVVAVVDETYQDALDLMNLFAETMQKLPPLNELTTASKDTLETLQQAYDAMTIYQKSFISKASIQSLQEYGNRMAELLKEEEKAAEAEEPEKTEKESEEDKAENESNTDDATVS